MSGRVLQCYGRRRLVQEVLQQELLGTRSVEPTLWPGSASFSSAAESGDAAGSQTEGPGRSRGRGRGQSVAAQLENLKRAGGRRERAPGAPQQQGLQRGQDMQRGVPGQVDRSRFAPPRTDRSQFAPPRPQQQDGGNRGRFPGQQQRPGNELRQGESTSGRFDDPDVDILGPSRDPRQGRMRRQSLQKRSGAEAEGEGDTGRGRTPRGSEGTGRGDPEEQRRSRGPGSLMAASVDDDGGLVEDSEGMWETDMALTDRHEPQHQRSSWGTAFDPAEEAAKRRAIQEWVRESRAQAGDSLLRGPWELEAADRPGALPSLYEIIKEEDHMFKMEFLDPDLDMPIGKPPPPRQPAPDVSLADALAQLKPDLMHNLGLKEGDESDEQLWAEVTDGAPELVENSLNAWKIPRARDTWADVEELRNFASELMPADHPMYGHVQRSLKMIEGNSSMKHEQKMLYMRRLVKDLTGPLPKRLEGRVAVLDL